MSESQKNNEANIALKSFQMQVDAFCRNNNVQKEQFISNRSSFQFFNISQSNIIGAYQKLLKFAAQDEKILDAIQEIKKSIKELPKEKNTFANAFLNELLRVSNDTTSPLNHFAKTTLNDITRDFPQALDTLNIGLHQ